MKPIAETIEVARALQKTDRGVDILGDLQRTADAVQELVPDCLGLSIAWLHEGVAFTLIASAEEIAVLDAVQYLAGGPSVTSAAQDQGLETTDVDLMDEEAWRMSSGATAHLGVASTLTMLLMSGREIVGTANLYGGSAHAFDGHHEELSRILGADVTSAVQNGDMPFTTRSDAERSPTDMQAQLVLNTAVGLLVGVWGMDEKTARLRLDSAASRAGISSETFATALVGLHR